MRALGRPLLRVGLGPCQIAIDLASSMSVFKRFRAHGRLSSVMSEGEPNTSYKSRRQCVFIAAIGSGIGSSIYYFIYTAATG